MMTPRDLLEYVDVLRVFFGLGILWTYLKAPRAAGKWFWFSVVLVVAIGALGLRPWIEHPSLGSWRSFGSLFQAIFNWAIAAVLILRFALYRSREGTEHA